MLRSPTALAVLMGLSQALFASGASAQGWLEDADRANGQGFRIGNLELHPGLGIEFGYDSNVFYQDTDPQGAAVMRLTGHLNANTPAPTIDTDGEAPRKLQFSGGLAASYFQYFGASARNNLGLDAHFDVTIRPEGRVAFRIYDQFGRAIRPFVDLPGEGPVPTYGRDRNLAGAEIILQSRRRVISGTFGYALTLDYYEDEAFKYVNNISHQVYGQLTYRFFPNTALISRTTAYFQDYFNPSDSLSALLIDNRRVTSEVGINGSITRTLAVTAMVGYTAGFYDLADDFDNVSLNLGAQWKPRDTMLYGIAFKRSFQSSFLGNFYRSNQISFRSQLLIGTAFLLGANAAVSFDQSGLALTVTGEELGNEARRSDIRVSAGVFAEYRFTSYLAANIAANYYTDITDYEYTNPPPGSVYPDPGGGYSKFEAWAGLRIFY